MLSILIGTHISPCLLYRLHSMCKMYFCKDCDKDWGDYSTCKLCKISNEYGEYKALISLNIGHIIGKDISTIIAKYCCEYGINPQNTICCNVSCKNIIIINSFSEFSRNADFNGRKTYKYAIKDYIKKYRVDNNLYDMSDLYQTYSLFGQYGRIFCADCTENKLKKCKIGWFINEKNGTLIYGKICKNKDTDECCKVHFLECLSKDAECQNIKGINGRLYPVKKCQYENKLLDLSKLTQHRLHKYFGHYIESKHDTRKEIMICKDCGYSNYIFTNTQYAYSWDWWREDSDDEFDDSEYDLMSVKSYNLSKDEHRFGNIYGNWRFTRKSNQETKVTNFKKHKKRKSFMKRENDKRSNFEGNKIFKKRYMLSLQF